MVLAVVVVYGVFFFFLNGTSGLLLADHTRLKTNSIESVDYVFVLKT